MAIIGIDLGTTNSLVAVWKDNKAVIIPNILEENLTPSVVSIDDKDGILIGQIAKERLITHPQLTVANFKRYMGTEMRFSLGSYSLTPEELSSFILKSLKADAEAYLGEEVQEAVISVPAYFNDSQRKATKRAGELAGLKVERLISEPTAAAIAYGLHEESNNTQFLIFDLGGGTFDISILEFFEGVMEVKSIAGDNYLGGEDFNSILASHFVDVNNIDIKTLDKKTVSALFKQAEKCKRELSDKNIGTMNLLVNNQNFSLEVNSDRFEKISSDLISRLKIPIEKSFRDADISTTDLDAVILIGGSTRMPIVKSIVSKMFRMLPFSNINPDEAVALGASIQAALKERNSDLKELILTDVCPYTLGIEVSNKINDYGILSPIIERNSPIPISRIERFATLAHNQTSINIKVYQGESRNVEGDINLGNLEVIIPPAPAGAQPVDVRFTYDINGLLEVEVTTVTTGKKKTLVIENSPGSMTKEEMASRLLALESIKIHPREKTENRLLLSRGERIYEESLGDKRLYISDLLTKYEEILETQDLIKIEKVSKELTQIFNELEKSY